MASRGSATLDDVRRHNLARLIGELHRNGPANRSGLVAYSGLNRSTVGVLVSELADAGLVFEGAGAAGQVGRPSLVVQPRSESAIVLAFDIRVERTVVAVVGLGGTVLFRKEQRHRRSTYTPQAAVKNVVSLTRQALGQAPAGAAWVGVGIGVPGVVNQDDGLVRLAPNLGWVDVPMGDLARAALKAEFGRVPTLTVGNDADLGAVAEWTRGCGRGTSNLIYVSGEVGVGGGIIVDGRLMLGAGGYGGEIGHMVVNPAGSRCRCGALGCWETEIGRDAIVGSAGLVGEQVEVTDVVAAAHAGDARAAAAVAGVGDWLGVGLANLVNLFNPEVLVLGGHLRHLLPLVSEPVTRRIQAALPAAREQARIEVPALNGDSTLLGAAESAFETLLNDPIGALAGAVRAG